MCRSKHRMPRRTCGTWKVNRPRTSPMSVFGSVQTNPSAVSILGRERTRGSPPRWRIGPLVQRAGAGARGSPPRWRIGPLVQGSGARRMGALRRREAPAPGHHAGPGRGCRRPPSGAGPSSFLPISRRVQRGAPLAPAGREPAGAGWFFRHHASAFAPRRVSGGEIPREYPHAVMAEPPSAGGPSGAALVEIDPLARELGERFRDAGFELHLVGGVVRDSLLGRQRDDADIDLTTSAKPPETVRVLKGWADQRYVQGARFGTVGTSKNGKRFEITTFREEMYPED